MMVYSKNEARFDNLIPILCQVSWLVCLLLLGTAAGQDDDVPAPKPAAPPPAATNPKAEKTANYDKQVSSLALANTSCIGRLTMMMQLY